MLFNKTPQLDLLKERISHVAQEFVFLTQDVGHQELIKTSEDINQHISDPYLFVIVGEVKAGKSSFINALLGTKEEVCKVAPSPMTDTIQEITFGNEPREKIINQHLKKIYQPVEILKEISIVDTPGTNTIIDHHQEITERFVPAADLIVFVFEAKNPYRESSWQFFDYINAEWWKKIIFVLQQKDLLEESDLEVNKKGVYDYAIKKGIKDPQVFAVSAKMELEQKTDSGYQALRGYINDNLLKGKAPVLKQKSNIQTLLTINNKLSAGLELRQDQYDADIKFREDVNEILSNQEKKTESQIDTLVENLIAAYDRVTQPKIDELRQGLGFISMLGKSIKSTFGSEDSPKMWINNVLEGIENNLNITLRDKLNKGVIDIADSIQQMGKMVDLKLRTSKTILSDDQEIFSDIAERRANVLKDLQESFLDFLNKTDNFYDKELARTTDNIAPNMAAASGITAVGVILAAVTNGMVFDITGGVLTTAGLLFAGVSLGLKRRKIMKEFTKEVEKGRDRFNSEVSKHLKEYTRRIKEKIDNNFAKFDQHLSKEGEQIITFTQKLEKLKSELIELNSKLDQLT